MKRAKNQTIVSGLLVGATRPGANWGSGPPRAFGADKTGAIRLLERGEGGLIEEKRWVISALRSGSSMIEV